MGPGVRLPAIPLLDNNLGKVVHTHCDTHVPLSLSIRSDAYMSGKVTVGLASHLLYLTDCFVHTGSVAKCVPRLHALL